MEANFKVPVLAEVEKEIIRQAGSPVNFPRGGNVFVAGDPADRVYLVEKGWLKIYRVSPDGRQVTVGSLRAPGELMGLAEALFGGRRSCYAGAVTDVLAYVISREAFLELMDIEPFLAVKISKILAGRMREAEEGVHQMASRQVSHRLAHTLLQVARVCGTPEKGGIRLNMELTHEELAAMVGSSRQTVSSILGKFKERHSIITERGRIRIIDPDNLFKVIG